MCDLSEVGSILGARPPAGQDLRLCKCDLSEVSGERNTAAPPPFNAPKGQHHLAQGSALGDGAPPPLRWRPVARLCRFRSEAEKEGQNHYSLQVLMVLPFQGAGSSCACIPRALPWARWCCPSGACGRGGEPHPQGVPLVRDKDSQPIHWLDRDTPPTG